MKRPNAPLPLKHRIREALSRVGMAMRLDEWAGARAAGLNPTQLAILGLVEGRGSQGLGVKEIAAHLGVTQPTATDSIAALERKGLIEKQPGMADRRAVRVVPTAEGRAALVGAGLEQGLAERAVGALDTDEQEALLLTLVKMIRHLQETGGIPIQRMCVTCRHFEPFAHADAARPHHCTLVDAAIGQRELRIDCRDHIHADADSRKILQAG